MPETIHMAYGVSRKHGTSYRCRAFVARTGDGYRHALKHTHRVAIGDTREEAEADALKYIRETYQRDALPYPEATVNHGKLSGAFLDNWHFGM